MTTDAPGEVDTAEPVLPGRRVHYAWVVFAASFVTLLGAAGFRSAPSVLIDPLRDEFGWDRATVGLAVSINVLLFGFIGPFAAALQARFGLRRVTVRSPGPTHSTSCPPDVQHGCRPLTTRYTTE